MSAGVALCLLAVALLAGTLPPSLGYRALVVLSGSMEPSLRVGDLAIMAPARADEVMVGDLVTFRIPEQPELLATHRLVGVRRGAAGRLVLETRGDADPGGETVPVAPEALVGRVAAIVPAAGHAVRVARRPEGQLLLIGLPGLLLLLGATRGTRRPGATRTSPGRAEAIAQPRFVGGSADELVARSHAALAAGDPGTARFLLDRARAADRRCTAVRRLVDRRISTSAGGPDAGAGVGGRS